MNLKGLLELSKKQFSSKSSIDHFKSVALDGLWESEAYVLHKYCKKGAKILDLGCGAGRTTFPLTKEGFNVLGVDMIPGMIAAAKQIAKKNKYKTKFIVGDATNLKLKNNSFDVVFFSNNAFTMIPSAFLRRKALNEIKRVLKNGGVFIFSANHRTYNLNNLAVWLKELFRLFILKPLGFNIFELEYGDMFFNKPWYSGKQFIHIYGKNEIKSELKKEGLTIIEHTHGNVTNWANRYPPPMFWVCKK